MGNLSGVVAILSVLLRPSLVVPHVQVPDIRHLDWEALHRNGVRYVVFDKDNCLTAPHSDELVTQLTASWLSCRRVFGAENVLMVSNSSGSSDDAAGLGAESLSRSLGVPVLCHRWKKPSAQCAREALEYFVALEHDRESVLKEAMTMPPGTAGPSKQLAKQRRKILTTQVPTDQDGNGSILLVGDRTMTDVVLAHRMNDQLQSRRKRLGLPTSLRDSTSDTAPLLPQCISVLTTGIWVNEGRLNTYMRRLETRLTAYLIGRGIQPGQGGMWSPARTAPAVDWQTLGVRAPSCPTRSVGLEASASDSNGVSGAPAQLDAREPEFGALVLAALVRSLPPVVSRGLVGLARSTPVTWVMSNLQMGWRVMITGLEFGIRQAGLGSALNSSSRFASSFSASQQHVRRLPIDPELAPPESRPSSLRSSAPAASPWSHSQTRRAYSSLACHPARSSLSLSCSPSLSPLVSSMVRQSPRLRVLHTSPTSRNQNSAGQHGLPKVPRRNWIAALSALVIIPASYYVGMRLHDLKDQPAADQVADRLVHPAHDASSPSSSSERIIVESSSNQHASLKADSQTQSQPTSHRSVVEPDTTFLTHRKRDLQLSLLHLTRERDDVAAKLDRVHQRRLDSSPRHI
ncbi:hypothetical protein BCV70DRAFT_199822 [Testicularia cyperi]|uniref:HAD-superfamily phosphatase n=1 Tax=Testicularia cyperi TaxID=1882483 RepID=A0A317XRP3_9BASI|nr:hypothetical protein BCV70DRAFT_199822 [Testicularia cyperi]